LIECGDLTNQFGHFTAIDRVGFSVEKRFHFSFLDLNNSGRTTVVSMSRESLDPSDGRAWIASVNPGAVRSSTSRLLETMTQLNKASRPECDDGGRGANMPRVRQVAVKPQELGATGQP